MKSLVLGYGYTAHSLVKIIGSVDEKSLVKTTSRKGGKHIFFNLEDESTWKNIPTVDITYWTFPAAPLAVVEKFFEKYKNHLGKLIVIGATSALLAPEPGAWLDENAELDLSLERAQGENFLRSQGAILVMSSGIYGSHRNPLDWVKKGLVGKSDKYVNMIHVSDLSQILVAAGQRGREGALYIASDAHPQRWRDVIEAWEKRGLLSNTPEKESRRVSKRLNSSQTLNELRVRLQFQNFADSISEADL